MPAHAQMTAPGQFDVASTGAALYSIPIGSPPGTAGMKPDIKLEYNSQNSGNGPVGVGWSLSGVSFVERCPRTPAQDGANGGVNFDANDRFCIDGQRLVAITGTYGADSTEYRTEREGFSKIVSYGTAGSGPAWFKVWTKAGQIMEFGNTADSRIEAQGKTSARLWGLNKISDTKGNYFTVGYIEDNANGDFRVSRIDYTGNAAASVTPYASVRFVYGTRTDIVPAYQVGSVIKTQQRLTNVQTFYGETLVLDYRLTYDYSLATKRSRLTVLALCGADSSCMPALTFSYENGGFTTGGNLSFTGYINPVSAAVLSSGSGGRMIKFGDFNGDGITDFLAWDDEPGNNDWYIGNYSTGSLTFTHYANIIPIAQFGGGSAAHADIEFGDFNGDGLTDILYSKISASVPTDAIFINNGIGPSGLTFTRYNTPIATSYFQDQSKQIFVGDWNKDGRADLMIYTPGGGKNNWFVNNGISGGAFNFTVTVNPITTTNINDGNGIYLGDWNGDGITDVMWWNSGSGDNRWYVSNGAPGGTIAFTYYSNPISTTAINDGDALYFGDWNGDGITDVLWLDKSSGDNRWFINHGVSPLDCSRLPMRPCTGGLTFVLYSNPIAPTAINGGRGIFFGDWNGDGLTDVMWWNNATGDNRWYVGNGASGTGLSFTPYLNPIAPPASSDVPGPGVAGGKTGFFLDANGDGLEDAVFINSGSGDNRWFVNNAKMPDVLLSVGNGLGESTNVTYLPATKGAPFYTKGTDAVYPYVDLQGAFYGVNQVQKSTGIGAWFTSTYRYEGFKADLTGRGYQGFRSMVVRDEQTTIEQTTTYLQNWPYTGMVANRFKKLGSLELNRIDSTYGVDALGGIRVFPKLNQTVEYSKDLDGSTMPSTTTAYQYDAYGNVTQVTTTSSDGYVKTTVNTYFNDTTNWFLGRLTRATMTSQTP